MKNKNFSFDYQRLKLQKNMSTLRKSLLFYHKGLKVISQRTQSIKYQHISTCTLCAFFVVENIFRSGLIYNKKSKWDALNIQTITEVP